MGFRDINSALKELKPSSRCYAMLCVILCVLRQVITLHICICTRMKCLCTAKGAIEWH